MNRVQEWCPDIVFLDVEMNGVSGLELARELPPYCCLIFTTAYAHYALDGYEVNAVDFLHKPYFYDRFDRAMQKAIGWLRMHDLLRTSESPERQLILTVDYKKLPVPFDSIVYIESEDNYVKLHLADGSTIISKTTLTSVAGMLPRAEYLRIHRSYIAAKSRIKSYSRTEITVSPPEKKLPVGKKYAEAVTMSLKK